MAKKTGGLGADAIFGKAPTPTPKTEPAKPPTADDASRASNVTLPNEAWEWIDAKHASARSSGGAPLRKAAIIRSVFAVMMAVDVDLTGCQTEDEMIERFESALRRKYKPAA